MKKFMAIVLATVMSLSLFAAMSVSAAGDNLPAYKVDYENFAGINDDNSPFSFVWYSQGTGEETIPKKGFYTMKYFRDDFRYHGTTATGEKITVEGFPFFDAEGKCHPFYHGCPGMAFTAPYTGTVKISYNFANTGGRTVLYIYKNALPGEHTPENGHWIYNGYAEKKDSKLDLAASADKVYTFEADVEMGETIYFIIDDYDDIANDSTIFRIVEAAYTAVDKEDITFFVNYPMFAEINDDESNPFKITWYNQSTEPNYPNINTGAAIYDMKYDNATGLYFAYHPEYGNGLWDTFVRYDMNSNCHPSYHAGPGMTFTAPYSGTVEISFNYAINNASGKTALYISNNKVPGFVLNETQTGWLYNNYDEKIDSTTDSSKVYTFTAEVNKGDKIYFVLDDCDDMSNDSSLLKILKAKYTSVSGNTEPETEPVTEPVTEPATEPGTEPGTDPVTVPGTSDVSGPDDNPNTSDIVAKSVLAFGFCSLVVIAGLTISKKKAH